MAKSELKNRIRRLRFDHDEMTQQELANRAGVTRQTIIAIEGAKYAPSLPLAFRIASLFGEQLDECPSGSDAPGRRHELSDLQPGAYERHV